MPTQEIEKTTLDNLWVYDYQDDAEKLIKNALKQGYENGYEAGFEAGKEEGDTEGYARREEELEAEKGEKG
jgi:flagellar biosynthesis/type III secretory pathway protein FliH